MKYLFFGIPALLMLPIGIYFYFFAKRSLQFWKVPTQKRWQRWSIGIGSTVFCLLGVNIRGIGAIFVLHVFMLAIGMELLNLLCKRFCPWWKRLYCCGLLPFAGAALILTAGYVNMQHVVQQDYTIETTKAMREEGYQLAFISDLHMGNTLDAEALTEYCRQIGELQPDLVILGGDIVDESTTKEEMQQAFTILGSIPCPYGVYFVYGNHDRANFSLNRSFTAAEQEQALTQAGIRVLSDESVIINNELTLVGRKDASFSGQGNRAPSAKLLEAIDQTHTIVLLDHQPRDLAENARNGVDLQLSGHTHAGQIWPINILNDLFHFNELNYGYETQGSFHAIVSSGMAGWAYPIRTSGHSEYVMVHLKEKV